LFNLEENVREKTAKSIQKSRNIFIKRKTYHLLCLVLLKVLNLGEGLLLERLYAPLEETAKLENVLLVFNALTPVVSNDDEWEFNIEKEEEEAWEEARAIDTPTPLLIAEPS